MAEDQNTAIPTKDKQEDSKVTYNEEVDLRPLRTLKGDLVRLMENKKISEDELGKLDKKLKRDAEAYLEKGGDEKLLETLNFFSNIEAQAMSANQTAQFGGAVVQEPILGTKRKEDIIAVQIPKERARSEELKKNIPSPEQPKTHTIYTDKIIIKEEKPKATEPPEKISHEKYVEFKKNIPDVKHEPQKEQKSTELHETGAIFRYPTVRKHEEDNKEEEKFLVHPKHELPNEPPKKIGDVTITVPYRPGREAADLSVGPQYKMPPKHEDKLPEPVKIKKTIQEIFNDLEREENNLNIKLITYPEKIKSLDDTLQKLNSQKNRLASFVTPLKEKENELEQKEEIIEESLDKVRTSGERHETEQKRWVIEDQRREIEQKRWSTDQEIIKLQKSINDVSAKKKELEQDEEYILSQLRSVGRKKRALHAEKERDIYIEKLENLDSLKEPIEFKWIDFNEKKKIAQEEVKKLNNNLDAIRDKMRDLTESEKMSQNPEGRHKLEVERWKTEEKRRHSEKEIWGHEQLMEKLDKGVEELGIKYQTILNTEKALEAKIKETDNLILEAETGT